MAVPNNSTWKVEKWAALVDWDEWKSLPESIQYQVTQQLYVTKQNYIARK